MHLDLETNDVEAEVRRIEALGATCWDHQQERGHDFWVLRDPWETSFVCYLQSSPICWPAVNDPGTHRRVITSWPQKSRPNMVQRLR